MKSLIVLSALALSVSAVAAPKKAYMVCDSKNGLVMKFYSEGDPRADGPVRYTQTLKVRGERGERKLTLVSRSKRPPGSFDFPTKSIYTDGREMGYGVEITAGGLAGRTFARFFAGLGSKSVGDAVCEYVRN